MEEGKKKREKREEEKTWGVPGIQMVPTGLSERPKRHDCGVGGGLPPWQIDPELRSRW